jgi:epoxyqueuosine reductase
MGIRDAIKLRAGELGFDLVGIAPATPGRDLDFIQEWLRRGFAGEMAYLSNLKRHNPKFVLPSLQSVICVGLIYDTPVPYSIDVGSRQQAGGRKKESGDRSQESGAGIEAFKRSVLNSASDEPQSGQPQPSLSGRGWPREAGTGEGADLSFSDFAFRSSTAGRRDAGAPRGWIARYAWGRDYHEIMRSKLEKLRAAINEFAPEAETRVYVDTGPVSERAFARFSGLGWMGKNTCLINEEKGSWFFLGVILTSLALNPDLPAPDRCGSCRACLDACPTGALVEPYIMDASRCISYLTIELKGAIPQDLRAGMGANVFGCDICQDVCPWNRRSQDSVRQLTDRSQEKGFEPISVSIQQSAVSNPQASNLQSLILNHQSSAPSLQTPAPSTRSPIQNPKSKIQNPPGTRHPTPDTFSLYAPPLAALASMTEDDYRENFRHSALKRAKYRGWLRNLCVAMGNSGDARFITKLQELAAHADPIVREHAEWALAQIQHPTDS